MPEAEEMKSLYKVYKSVQVDMGEKKEVTYKEKSFNKTEISADNTNNSLPKEEKRQEISEEEKALLKEKERVQEEIQALLEEAEKEKQRILKEAEAKKNKVLEEARKKGKEEGYDKGYKEGFEKGQNEGYKEETAYIDEAKSLKQEMLQKKKELGQDMEELMVTLVLETFRRVLGEEVQKDSEMVLKLIQNGMEKATHTEKMIIRTGEEDFDVVDLNKNKLFMMTEGIDEIEVKLDRSYKKNEFVIETHSGMINTSLETQIQQIEKAFRDLLLSE